MRIDTDLRGIEDVYRVLNQIAPREARNIMRSTLGGMAAEINKEAKSNAPRADGDLRRAMKLKRPRIRNNVIRVNLVVQIRAFYWRFIEYGTSKLPEQPFYMPAVERFRGQAMRSFLNQFVTKFEASLARARRRNGG